MRGKRGGLSKLAVYLFLILWLIIVSVGYFSHHSVSVLDPAGTIGHQERNLMILAFGLCMIVVIPVFALAIFIAVRYREGNPKKTTYKPNWDGNRWIEATWWAVPIAIIATLAVVAWTSSYRLDPYKALAAPTKPLNVQVVALDWKWLFIYPDQNIASVNQLHLPIDRPVSFHVTSDSVMNSFWIPALGGQIYAMPGMDTQLHLQATKIGNYRGSSANISGSGFANMHFNVFVSSDNDFKTWIQQTRSFSPSLDQGTYRTLATPGNAADNLTYSGVVSGLYFQIVNNYIGPLGRPHGGHSR